MDRKETPWYHKTDRELSKTEIEELQTKDIFIISGHWSQIETFILHQNWVNFATKKGINGYLPMTYLGIISDKSDSATKKKRKLLIALSAKLRNRCGALILSKFTKYSKEGWNKFIPMLPPDTPWYHTVSYHLGPKHQERLREEGVQLTSGKFTYDEDMKIIQNWETFVEKRLDDSLTEAKHWTGIEYYRRIYPVEKMSFVCALSRGLYDRTGSQIFKRFWKMVNEKVAVYTDYETIKNRIGAEFESENSSLILKLEGQNAVANRIGCTPIQLSNYINHQRRSRFSNYALIANDLTEQQTLIDVVMQQTGCKTEDQAIFFPVKQINFVEIQKKLLKLEGYLYKRMWLKLRLCRCQVQKWELKESYSILRSVRKQNPSHKKFIDWDRVAADVDIRPVLKDTEEMRLNFYRFLYEFFKCGKKRKINQFALKISVLDIPLCKALDIIIQFCNKPKSELKQMFMNCLKCDGNSQMTLNSKEEERAFVLRCVQESTSEHARIDTKWKDIPMKPFIKSLKHKLNPDDESIDFDAVFMDAQQISSAKRLKRAWKKLQTTVPSHLQTPYDRVRYLRKILRKRKTETELTVRHFMEEYRQTGD